MSEVPLYFGRPASGQTEPARAGAHGARPVHLIITMIQWIRTSRLSIKKSLSAGPRRADAGAATRWCYLRGVSVLWLRYGEATIANSTLNMTPYFPPQAFGGQTQARLVLHDVGP